METTYLKWFCELLDDNLPLDGSTALSFYHKLKFECMPKLKSEISKNLISTETNSEHYLDFVINEIKIQDYQKNVDLAALKRHFERREVSENQIIDVLNFNLDKIDRDFYRLLNTEYKSFQPFSPEKDEAFQIQTDLVYYVCSSCANEMINHCKSKFSKAVEKSEPFMKDENQKINHEYLEVFCQSISEVSELQTTSLWMLWETSISHFTSYLIAEINEKLVLIDFNKRDDYLEFLIERIFQTPFASFKDDIIAGWLKMYDSSAENFPQNIKPELQKKLNTFSQARHLEPTESLHLQDMQNDFFVHLAREEAQKIIAFLEKKKVGATAEKMEKKPNQLTANQIVLLLHEIGLFIHPKIEDASQVKQAELISKITGLNKDNFRNHIRKLENYKGPNIPPKYQADIDKIDQILNNLE